MFLHEVQETLCQVTEDAPRLMKKITGSKMPWSEWTFQAGSTTRWRALKKE
jgi:hypothetical protein